MFFLNNTIQSPNFWTFKEPKNQFQGINTARWCSLAGRYDNPIPTRFLAPLDCVKIPTQLTIGQFVILSVNLRQSQLSVFRLRSIPVMSCCDTTQGITVITNPYFLFFLTHQQGVIKNFVLHVTNSVTYAMPPFCLLLYKAFFLLVWEEKKNYHCDKKMPFCHNVKIFV